jgi:hypothetical protein
MVGSLTYRPPKGVYPVVHNQFVVSHDEGTEGQRSAMEEHTTLANGTGYARRHVRRRARLAPLQIPGRTCLPEKSLPKDFEFVLHFL